MKICVAQTRPVSGDILANIEAHKKLIALAVPLNADTIFFPELSITGYEPTLAETLATNQDDKRFDDFQKISDTKKITIGIGVPTRSNAGIKISMVIFEPNKTRQTYSKQQLHADELQYFVGGDNQVILTINNVKIAPAICYESLQPSHCHYASELGAEVYVASVAKSQKGVDKGLIHYPQIAQRYSLPVLMANSIGMCDNFHCAGKTAVWTAQGRLVAQLDETHEGIIIFDTDTEQTIERRL